MPEIWRCKCGCDDINISVDKISSECKCSNCGNRVKIYNDDNSRVFTLWNDTYGVEPKYMSGER